MGSKKKNNEDLVVAGELAGVSYQINQMTDRRLDRAIKDGTTRKERRWISLAVSRIYSALAGPPRRMSSASASSSSSRR